MAKRTRRIIRRSVKEEPEDELELEEAELEAEEVDADEADDDAAGEMEEDEAPKKSRVHARVARKMEPEEEELDEDEEPEEAPKSKKVSKPVVKIGVKAKNGKKAAAEEPEEEEEPEEAPAKKVSIKKVSTQVAGEVLTQLLEGMDAGKAIMISKTDEDKWTLTITDAAKVGPKMRGKAFWATVRDPKYTEWMTEWRNLTYAEKVAKAKKAGVKWEKHENPKIDVIRLTAAMRSTLGIEKYKEEYRDRASRAALRGG